MIDSVKVGITHVQAEILRILSETGERMCGQELISASGFYYDLKMNSVYSALSRMEPMGYVISDGYDSLKGHIGFPKHYYRVTDCGRKMLESYKIGLEALALRKLN